MPTGAKRRPLRFFAMCTQENRQVRWLDLVDDVLALRYIEKSGIDFTDKLSYRRSVLHENNERISVHTA